VQSLTAENNLRRIGISDLQKSQVTSLGKTKFESLELLRGGEWDFFPIRCADLNSATPMSTRYICATVIPGSGWWYLVIIPLPFDWSGLSGWREHGDFSM